MWIIFSKSFSKIKGLSKCKSNLDNNDINQMALVKSTMHVDVSAMLSPDNNVCFKIITLKETIINHKRFQSQRNPINQLIFDQMIMNYTFHWIN